MEFGKSVFKNELLIDVLYSNIYFNKLGTFVVNNGHKLFKALSAVDLPSRSMCKEYVREVAKDPDSEIYKLAEKYLISYLDETIKNITSRLYKTLQGCETTSFDKLSDMSRQYIYGSLRELNNAIMDYNSSLSKKQYAALKRCETAAIKYIQKV